jgi:hypothetical protein
MICMYVNPIKAAIDVMANRLHACLNFVIERLQRVISLRRSRLLKDW